MNSSNKFLNFFIPHKLKFLTHFLSSTTKITKIISTSHKFPKSILFAHKILLNPEKLKKTHDESENAIFERTSCETFK